MTLRTSKKNVPVELVPEVGRLVMRMDRLNAFIQANQAIFDQYQQLGEDYNTALEDADKRLRTMCDDEISGISCGPFKFKHFATKYNADALMHELGDDEAEFQRLGGVIKTVRVNEIDPAMMESLIERGVVPSLLQRTFVKRAANYDKPKKVGLL